MSLRDRELQTHISTIEALDSLAPPPVDCLSQSHFVCLNQCYAEGLNQAQFHVINTYVNNNVQLEFISASEMREFQVLNAPVRLGLHRIGRIFNHSKI